MHQLEPKLQLIQAINQWIGKSFGQLIRHWNKQSSCLSPAFQSHCSRGFLNERNWYSKCYIVIVVWLLICSVYHHLDAEFPTYLPQNFPQTFCKFFADLKKTPNRKTVWFSFCITAKKKKEEKATDSIWVSNYGTSKPLPNCLSLRQKSNFFSES